MFSACSSLRHPLLNCVEQTLCTLGWRVFFSWIGWRRPVSCFPECRTSAGRPAHVSFSGSKIEGSETRRSLVHLVPVVRAVADRDTVGAQVQGTAARSWSAPCVWRDSSGMRRAPFVSYDTLQHIAEAAWSSSGVLCCDAGACDEVRHRMVTPTARSLRAGGLSSEMV